MLKIEGWRLINSRFINPYFNMALEEAIAKTIGEGLTLNTVRFWRNNKSIVLGRFQSIKVEIDLNACIKHNVAIVRRFTGGGAVYHDLGNLNYSIIVNREGFSLRDVQEFFMKNCLSIIEALKILGLNPNLEKPNNILIHGKKVSGAAGAIKWNSIVHHSCILVSANLSILRDVLNCFKNVYAPSERWVSSRKMDVANLKDFLNKKLSLNEVKEALKKGFEKVYKVKLSEEALSLKELNFAKKLYKNKYSRYEWNFEGLET